MKFSLEIYQWLVPLISVFFIVRTILQHKANRRTLRGLMIWISFWVSLAVFALVPNAVSQKLATMLGIKDNVNAIIFIGLGILFFLIFSLSSTVDRLERQITELVRENAKERAQKGEK
ncbi:MAG: DUF2304 family protein [Saprospiraceae bacterium]|nr:DUF2304 family protein [Lewinella sp.]